MYAFCTLMVLSIVELITIILIGIKIILQRRNGKKAMFIILSIVILIAVTFVGVFTYNNALTPVGKNVSEQHLVKNIKKIMFTEKLRGLVTFSNDFEELKKQYNYPVELEENHQVVVLNLASELFKTVDNNNEIRVLVRTLLYVKTHGISIPINGVAMDFAKPFQGKSYLAMTIDEFVMICSELDIENLSYKKQIDVLTNIIIEKSKYKRI